MTEQQKPQVIESSSTQDPQQIQILLKETLKENKSLVSKNSKLESKYVELFKQNKLLKQDRNVLVTFCSSHFADSSGKSLFDDLAFGQVSKETLETAGEQKINAFIKKIQELQNRIANVTQELKNQANKEAKQLTQKLKTEYENRLKSSKDQQSKEAHSLQREIQSLKKNNEIKSKQITDLKARLDSANTEMSKISKQKLKMEHHLNNIRKRQISQELEPPKEADESKTLVDKNQYLSLKQQVEMLMSKRDELRRQVKKKEEEIASEHRNSLAIQQELDFLKHIQQENSQKYELIKECSLQELQNMILSYHAAQSEKAVEQDKKKTTEINGSKKYIEIDMAEEKEKDSNSQDPKFKKRNSTEEQIKRQYLKNMVARYIKAETSGNSEQSMTLLQIIGRLVGLDNESTQNLSNYISKHKQWWYVKY